MRTALPLVLVLALALPARAQTLESAFPSLPAFSNPVDLQAPDDGSNRLFVVEQSGRIKVFENDAAVTSSTVFLDLSGLVTVGSETGLLGLAFDPNYAQNGYFYVDYTAPGPLHTVVARYRVSAGDPNVADPGSATILMTVNQPFSNHNAGQIAFGPPEGPGGERYLYVSLGDGGSGGDPLGNGQNLGTLLASLLRLDVNGGGLPLDCASGTGAATIPPSNPFVGQPDACDEIYAYGFRNPWRFSFDAQGRLWVGDVGQDAWEEVDIVEAGGNYGWSMYEGNHCYHGPCNPDGKTFPIFEYPHAFSTSGGYAEIGGYVYDGPSCAALRGLYVYGDEVTGNVWTLDYDGTTATNALLLGLTGRSISSFGLSEQHDLFLTDLGSDRVYRFACQQDVTVTVTPVDPPLVVGPGGGPIAFDVRLTNTTGTAQTFDAWADADLSNGGEVAHVIGPRTATLPAGASVVRRVQVNVPALAPAGTSTLTVKVGRFPDGSDSSDRLTVLKQAGAAAAAEASATWTATWGTEEAAPDAAAEAVTEAPAQVALLGAEPNPFGDRTTLRFTLPEAADARVEVLDLLGRRVALLADGPAEAGTHTVVWDGAGAPAGVYVVRLATGTAVRTLRVTRLR